MKKSMIGLLAIAHVAAGAMMYRNAEPGTDGAGAPPTIDPAAVAAQKAQAAAELKAQKEAEKAALKEAKAKEKADAKAAKEAEKEAKRQAKEAEKAAKAANVMPEQNGIRRPADGTNCGNCWAIMDQISAETGQPAAIKSVLERGTAAGLNEATLKTQYARWRKFNGVTGYVVDPSVAAEKAAKEAEKKAKEEAKAAEKLAKAQAAAEAKAAKDAAAATQPA